MYNFYLPDRKVFFCCPRWKRPNKYRQWEKFYKSIRESIEQFIISFWEKLTQKAKIAPLIHPRWIYTIHPEKYEICFALWTTFRPPKPYFRIIH